jgi:hypothetical protein
MQRIERLLVATIVLVVTFSNLARAEDAEWLVAPYVWLPSVSLEQVPGDGGSNISAENLLDKTDAVGMIRIETARDQFGLTLDYIFLDLSDTRVIPPTGPGGSLPVSVISELELTVFEIGGFYRFSGEDNGLHALFGYRGISANTTVLATPDGGLTDRTDTDSGLSDIFLGARYVHRYNRWDFTARGDYSFGESDGVLNLLASVGFRFTDWFALQGGYRYSALDFSEESEQGDRISTDVELSGPFLGFVFRF